MMKDQRTMYHRYVPDLAILQALKSLKSSSEAVSLLEKLSKQMLSLESQFDSNAVCQEMSALTTELHQLHSKANSSIQNAVSHRIKFAEEHMAIADDWLGQTRTLVDYWAKGEEECLPDKKEVGTKKWY